MVQETTAYDTTTDAQESYDPLPVFAATVVRSEYTTVGTENLPKYTLTFTSSYRAYNREEKRPYAARAWFTVTKWRDQADHWQAYNLQEGQQVRIAGMPTVRSYKDRDGNDKVVKTPELLNAELDETSLYEDLSFNQDLTQDTVDDLGI